MHVFFLPLQNLIISYYWSLDAYCGELNIIFYVELVLPELGLVMEN